MKATTKITLSNGIELSNIYTVLETLAVNGYKNARIIFKGEGVCDGRNGESLTFRYN